MPEDAATSRPSGVLPGLRITVAGLPEVALSTWIGRRHRLSWWVWNSDSCWSPCTRSSVSPRLPWDIEQDAPRHLLEAVAEQVDHRIHHADERGLRRQVLKP
jgi:hypothetical protein